jgi:hypothetical protein
MINYVNKIACAYNNIEKNFVLRMLQEEPADVDHPEEPHCVNEIVSVVISQELALKMAENITSLFQK